MTKKQTFSGWRKYIWPIHMSELAKVIPACILFFCIVYVYTCSRLAKDSQVIAFGGHGALPIPYLKLFVFITSLTYTIAYAIVSNKVSKSTIMYSICTFYTVFFILFRWVLLPNHTSLQLIGVYNFITANYPAFTGLAIVIRDWDVSLFYILAELFGSIMISAEFFMLANNISKISEAKRFYAVFGLVAQMASMSAGFAVRLTTGKAISSLAKGSLEDSSIEALVSNWLPPLTIITVTLIAGTMIIFSTYWYITSYVMTNPNLVDMEQLKSAKKKLTMSVTQAFTFLTQSKHILYLTFMVLSYGGVINIIEIIWKDSWKLYFHSPAEIAQFQGAVVITIGASTMFITLFVSHNLLRVFSWSFVAYATPILLLISAIPFAASIILGVKLDGFILAYTGLALPPGMLAVYAGAGQNVIAKACKYALFDPTKEMVYINRDQETKSKGKVAVDILGARTGKFSGSLVKMIEDILIGSQMIKSIVSIAVIISMLSAWIFAVKKLGKLMNDEVSR
ncbi:MAG: hypothetical protein KAH32_01395 [Chlamydiia bacterium]|nr:hypothetical protein [Chlamydiia bacterium]